MNRASRTVASARPHDFGDASGSALIGAVRDSGVARGKRAHDFDSHDEEWFTFEREMTDVEIARSWEENALLKRNMGTEAHLQMQLYVEGQPHRSDDAEVVVGKTFLDRIVDDWEAYRTEWEVVAPDADLAGSIDLVIRHRNTGKLAILDYKRSPKLCTGLRGFAPMLSPFSHLQDCDGAAYALQLSIYQYMLETFYGAVVCDRVLISLSPEAPFATSVPYLRDEVTYLMTARRLRRSALDRCTEELRCPLSHKPLHDAVFAHVDGSMRTVDAKTARAKGLDVLGVDGSTRERVEALVAAVQVEHPLPKFTCKWHQVMPKGGIVPSIFSNN